jgi:hypothetical protein
MLYLTANIDRKTPGKLISKKVLYNIDTAEELVTTRSRKDRYWTSIYKKKNGQLFLANISKNEDDEMFLNEVEIDIEKIQEYMSDYFSIKQYETVFGKVEE